MVYLPGKMRMFQCYVSLREGNYYAYHVFLLVRDLRCSWAVCGVEDDLVQYWGLHLPNARIFPIFPGGGEKRFNTPKYSMVWSIYLHLASSLWWNVGKNKTPYTWYISKRLGFPKKNITLNIRRSFSTWMLRRIREKPWRSSPVLLNGGQIYQKFIPLKRCWIKSDLQLFKVVDMSWWFWMRFGVIV